MEVFFIYRDDEIEDRISVCRYSDEADALAETACNKVRPSVVLRADSLKAETIADDPDRFTEFYIHVFDDACCFVHTSDQKASRTLANLIEWDDGEPSIRGYKFTICQRDAGTDPVVECWFDRDELKQGAADAAEDSKYRQQLWNE